ncbi:site-2 protease family protein [Terricaulis sp.]|uniref:site-2 protease family protein n=1 Tax=Terricaulis sp. TaxID=2768686 RepID=UPI0037832AA4
MSGFVRFIGDLVRPVAGVLAIFAIILVISADSISPDLYGWRWGFLLAGWFPVIFLHELGHALAAQLAGWRVLAFHVAPWALRLRPFRLSFAGHLGGPDIGGYVAAVPRTLAADSKWRQTWFTAGGPIASWICVLVCFALAVFAPWNAWVAPSVAGASLATTVTPDGFLYFTPPERLAQHDRQFIQALCFGFGLYALCSAMLSTWPRFQNGRGVNDAGMIADLWRSKTHTPADPLSYAMAMLHYGVPRRAWPPWVSDGVQRHNTSDTPATAHAILALACLMERDDPGAREQAAILAALAPDAADSRIIQALVAALADTNAAGADDHLAGIKGLEVSQQMLRLRQIAIAAIVAKEDAIAAINRIDAATPRGYSRIDFPGSLEHVLDGRVVERARGGMRLFAHAQRQRA